MANSIDRIRLFGVTIVATTADESSPHTYLRDPEWEMVSSGGGGMTLCLLEEKYVQEHDQQGAQKFCSFDDHVVTSTSSFSIVDYDVVDTSLTLSTAVSRNSDPTVYSPMPLRWFPPVFIPEAGFCLQGYNNVVEVSSSDQVDQTLNTGSDEKREKSRKRKQDDVDGEKKRRVVKRKRDNDVDDQNSQPDPSMEEIPGLVQTIESRNITKPVFLYQKRLEESDVNGHYNRLFVTRKDTIMSFLSDEEFRALDDSKEGLKISAVDPQGKLYKLGLKIWQSLKMMVINSDWSKLVIANNAQKGDLIQMWGYRESNKLRFAINFRKPEA